MKVLSGPPSGWTVDRRTATAIGVFDGMHIGHQAVVRATTVDGLLLPAVLTFSTHPATVLAPEGEPPQLSTLEQRLEYLEAEDVAIVALVEFDEPFRLLSPGKFVEAYLVAGLNAGNVSVGSDFRFGHNAAGTVATLEQLGLDRGFDVRSIDPVVVGGHEVRSSRIRELVASGDVVRAAALLGHPYAVRGVVIRGEGRGRSIGIPTANLEPAAVVALPAEGVYAVTVSLDGEWHDGVANLGHRPTFDGSEEILEAHIFDFDGDLYGREVDIAFIERIRDERRFESIDALVGQIERDITEARKRLGRAS